MSRMVYVLKKSSLIIYLHLLKSDLYLNNQSVFALLVFDHSWIGSLVVGVLGIAKVRMAVTTNN